MRKNVYLFGFSIFFLFCGCFTASADITSKAYVDSLANTKVNNADLATKIADAITVKEDVDNKVQNFENADATKYPSALAVKTALDTKVDVSDGTTQTLAGTYTVTGTLSVPTPALPE